MKLSFLIIGLITLIIIQSFCSIKSKKQNKHHKTPPTTTLDSLQGSWINYYDSTFSFSVVGRVLDEVYTHDSVKHSYSTILFSDTLIDDVLEKNFVDISIDTSLLSGKYLIKVERDSTIWCYEINGFNTTDSGTTFSMSDTWAKRRATAFKKQ